MRFQIAAFLVLFCSTILVAQRSPNRIEINGAIDTSDSDISKVIQLWTNYLNSNPDSTYDNQFWLNAEKKKYKKFDLLNSTYFSPSLYFFLPYWKATVISVSEIDSGFVIRTVFATQTEGGFTLPKCITQIAAVKEDGQFKLANVLPINTKSWQRERLGSITFVFPPTHQFNRLLAERMSGFVDSLIILWNLTAFDTEYYFAEDLAQLYNVRGFDFYIGEGNRRRAGGSADIANRIVWGGGQNEWYPHEFVHIYINPLFPNGHPWFLEGYATLLGGSQGQELRWHLKRMDQHLRTHPEFDLDSLLNFWHMDYYTNPANVIGALLCKLAQEKGGLSMIRELMSSGKENNDFYKTLETVFGVKRNELGKFIRRKVTEYATK